MKRSVALLGLLLASAGLASAQDVAFQTVSQGPHAGYGQPANHVIRSQAELVSTGVDRLIPPGTTIDFSQDMLIAVLMGTKNTGGYSIAVTKIERKQMMTILPVPGPPPSYYLEVQVDHRSPPPGSFVTMALTSPFHVVKLRRTSERVDFVGSSPAPTGAFTRVTFDLTKQPGSRGASLSLEADGSATVQRTLPNALIAPVHDRATAGEVAAVEAAVRGARLASVPDQLPVPVHIMAADTFRVEVASGSPALAGRTEGEPGYLQQYEARLRPLIEACSAIIDRIAPEAPPSVEAKGVVRVSGNTVWLFESAQRMYRISGPITSKVRRLAGKTVKVEGRALSSAGPITRFEATAFVNPVERTDASVQVQPSGAGIRVFVEGRRARRYSGPAASVLRAFPGRSHEVDGFVFTSPTGEPDELFAEACAGKATEFSPLTRNGQWVGYVTKGQRLEVLLVDGSYALVRAGTRTGWARLSRIEAGEVPVPLHGPTPGLTGSVPGQ